MNARQKAKRLAKENQRLFQENMHLVHHAWATDVNVLVYNAISTLHERFGRADCKRWVEFNVEHKNAGKVHVVLMKPGSKAEELAEEQQQKIQELEAQVATLKTSQGGA